MSVKTSRDDASLQAFAEQIWKTRPASHNRSLEFYEYLWKQPQLRSGESPMARVLDETGATVGMLGFFTYSWRNHTLYSAVSFYTQPSSGASSGMQLAFYWLRHSDIAVAGHPRQELRQMFERAGWKRQGVTVMCYPLRFAGVRYLYGRRQSAGHAIKMLVRYTAKLLWITRPRIRGVHEEVDAFSDEMQKFLKELRREYDFTDRTRQDLQWRYFSWHPKHSRFRVYVVRERPDGSMLGYAVLRQAQSGVVQVCELFARPSAWPTVIGHVVKVAQKYHTATCLVSSSQTSAVLAAFRQNNFFGFRTVHNYIKGSASAQADVGRMLQDNFLMQPSDSDEYLL